MLNDEILNDDAFARLVSEDVKNKISSKQKQILLNPRNWDRWKTALILLSENLDDQLFNLSEDEKLDESRYLEIGETVLAEEAKLSYQNKTNKITRFKFHVDRRLDEVALMIEKNEKLKDYDVALDPLIDFYRKAITTHRFLIYEYDLEETSIDKALWSTLDGKWEFSDITIDNL